MLARIYKPAKTAMQSGKARTKEWVLDYEPEARREHRASHGLDRILALHLFQFNDQACGTTRNSFLGFTAIVRTAKIVEV